MSDNDNSTVKTIAELQEMMFLFWKELQELKSGATNVATNPPPSGNQPPAALGNALNTGNSGNRSGGAQRKRGRETNEEEPDTDEEFDAEIDADSFQLSEAGEAFLQTAFSKRMDRKNRAQRVEKLGMPDCRWTKCPTLDPVVAANLPKDTIRNDLRAKQLQEYWLDAASPLIAALEDIQEDRASLQEATKAMQEALYFLGNASQHHAVHRRQAILQQLNPQLKPLVKDEDFVEAPPFLFGENFSSVAKECLEAAAVLKKSVCTTNTKQQGFYKSHPQKGAWGRRGGRFRSGQDHSRSRKGHGMVASSAKPGTSQGKK